MARQAAELQQLSLGRFELGVGLSWNEAEYAAVGADFNTIWLGGEHERCGRPTCKKMPHCGD